MRPRGNRSTWVVVARADHDGRALHVADDGVLLGAVGTILTMARRPRGWKEASARLPDGTEVEARRRRRVRRGCEFVFDRMLPAGTEIIIAGRAAASLPEEHRQWWQ